MTVFEIAILHRLPNGQCVWACVRSCNCCCCMMSSDLWAPQYRRVSETRNRYCVIDMITNRISVLT